MFTTAVGIAATAGLNVLSAAVAFCGRTILIRDFHAIFYRTPLNDYPYQFDAEVVRMPFANVLTTVVFPPAQIVKELRLDEIGRIRIDGEINEVRFEAAINPSKSGWYILLSKRFRKECGLDIGDQARVSFDLADPDAVNIPNELRFAIEANDKAQNAWDETTTGKKRSFAHYIDTAKRAATREKRVDEVLDFILGKKELPKRKRK